MDDRKELEEKLREAASIGDQNTLEKMLKLGVNVNAKHRINGWTALHWASKRGHPTIVRFLLENGADLTLTNGKGETAAQLTDKEDIHSILGGKPEVLANASPLPITPNYIQNPPFPYLSTTNGTVPSPASHVSNKQPITDRVTNLPQFNHSEELVLKVRVANSSETDFIEIELDRNERTLANLVLTCCRELNCEPQSIIKLRKLPNTIIRKDKDVWRLTDFQELELVLQKFTGNTRIQDAFQTLIY
ncbi:ankyrin repeat domain-containing protein 40-like [Asterias rubens]|uniref:ankyrin repeat domain-containing protein 40-like n=1 Tax=Asterias rubens TaxID=7604 RepID=UPI0014556C95|nr:ankyrin repeat domain-containing protein 40-like [Asterias rubens]